MSQRQDFIKIARAELGTIEGPKDNETKYGKFTKANFQPWCGSFVMWCANEVGLKLPNVVGTAAGAAAFQKKKQWQDAVAATPEAGDIVFFDFPGDGVDRISHVGIVVRDNGDGTVTTVEGNTAPDKKGDQRNGGQVCLKTRAYLVKNRGKLKPSLPVFVSKSSYSKSVLLHQNTSPTPSLIGKLVVFATVNVVDVVPVIVNVPLYPTGSIPETITILPVTRV